MSEQPAIDWTEGFENIEVVVFTGGKNCSRAGSVTGILGSNRFVWLSERDGRYVGYGFTENIDEARTAIRAAYEKNEEAER